MRVSLNIALTVVAVISIGLIGYFVVIKDRSSVTLPIQNTETTASATKSAEDISYANMEYGFNLRLPGSWQGYSIINDEWIGNTVVKKIETPSEKGPLVLIRHPAWTKAQPRQNIPVMVITIEQWNALQKEKFHIGAAPITPTELGRNTKYVFALPPSYNSAFLTGYDEVRKILATRPLKAF